MFIDTQAANRGSSSSSRPIHHHHHQHHHQQQQHQTPLLETFIGQHHSEIEEDDDDFDHHERPPPPSYLEATTPLPWACRPSGDEGTRLLSAGADTSVGGGVGGGGGRASFAPVLEEGVPSSELRDDDDADADADDANDYYYKDGLTYWRKKKKSFREHCSWKRVAKWVGAILAQVLVIAGVVAAATAGSRREGDTLITSPAAAAESAESAIPPHPTTTTTTADSQQQQNFPIRWPATCGKDYATKTEVYDFGSTPELVIKENIHPLLDGPPYGRVAGWIHVAPAPDGQPAGTVQAKMSYAVSSSVGVQGVKYARSGAGLRIGSDSSAKMRAGERGGGGVDDDEASKRSNSAAGKACLGMSVVLYVSEGATLQNVDISSTHLGVQVHEGAAFDVANKTSISLTSGTLDAAKLSSRETYLSTTSGSISGAYALLDVLSIATKSGSVDVNVEPKEAAASAAASAATDGSSSTSANFRANSLSGSIRADFNRNRIPDRDYQVSINTTVGSVDGTFIHGSKTHIRSVAGHITADVLPFHSSDAPSELSTSSTSGQTILRLGAPYKRSGLALRGLTSRHSSVSGAVNVTMPQEWEGWLEGSSTNGVLHLQGRDLEIVRRDDSPMGNYVEARKGVREEEKDEGSNMVFGTVSGECGVVVGKV